MSTPDNLAMLELWCTGRLRRRKAQASTWQELRALGWAVQGRRANELLLEASRREALLQRLNQAWPDWRSAWAALQAADLPPTPDGQRALRRRTPAGELPERASLNRHSAAAHLHGDAKARVGSDVGHGVRLTRDDVVRLRPHAGLHLSRDGHRVDVDALVACLGELVLPERAVMHGLSLTGPAPRAVLTVENLGPYVDVVVPDGVAVVHVPGWNTPTAVAVLRRLGAPLHLHFGDLDANGVYILLHLRALLGAVEAVVPPWWSEHLPEARKKAWSTVPTAADLPALVHTLATTGRWLEQERVATDPRFGPWLDERIAAHRDSP